MSMPLTEIQQPGVQRLAPAAAYAGNGTSPRTWTIQLPGYGAWMIYAFAWYTNVNQSIDATAVVSWFQNTASGSQMKNLANSRQIGVGEAAVDGASGAANLWTGLTIGDPSTSGVVTVTGEFSGGGSVNPRLIVRGLRLFSVSDFQL